MKAADLLWTDLTASRYDGCTLAVGSTGPERTARVTNDARRFQTALIRSSQKPSREVSAIHSSDPLRFWAPRLGRVGLQTSKRLQPRSSKLPRTSGAHHLFRLPSSGRSLDAHAIPEPWAITQLRHGSTQPSFRSCKSDQASKASRTHQENEMPVISFDLFANAFRYFSWRSGSTLHRAIATLFGYSRLLVSTEPRGRRLGSYMTYQYHRRGFIATHCIPVFCLIDSHLSGGHK